MERERHLKGKEKRKKLVSAVYLPCDRHGVIIIHFDRQALLFGRDRAGTAAQAAAPQGRLRASLSDTFFEYILCDHCFGRHLELILYISPGTLRGKS